jgi:peptidoglycan/LPS O-acetylase OafA/YrhL
VHVAALDGLRGLAILLVMVCHLQILPRSNAVDQYVGALLRTGWCGVDLFFVISGFLITGILFDAKGSAHYFRSFYARRVLRIFPLYYAFLVVALLAGPALLPAVFPPSAVQPHEHKWFWLYLSNLWLAWSQRWLESPALTVLWSLCIEEQFYLLWPLVVCACSRRTLIQICVATIVGSLVLRPVLLLAGAHSITIFISTPTRLDGLAMGALIALAARGPLGLRGLLTRSPVAAVVSGVVLASLLVLTWNRPALRRYSQAFCYSGFAVCFGALLVATLAAPRTAGLGWLFETRVLQTLGRYSYALYLVHKPVAEWLKSWLPAFEDWCVLGSAVPGQLAFYVLGIGVSLGVALLSWHLLEKHFLKLKKYFPYREAPVGGLATRS